LFSFLFFSFLLFSFLFFSFLLSFFLLFSFLLFSFLCFSFLLFSLFFRKTSFFRTHPRTGSFETLVCLLVMHSIFLESLQLANVLTAAGRLQARRQTSSISSAHL
jgi:hypothetical protein